MQDPNIFGCKIFRESMFLGLNFTLHAHTPVYKYKKYPPEERPQLKQCFFVATSQQPVAFEGHSTERDWVQRFRKE